MHKDHSPEKVREIRTAYLGKRLRFVAHSEPDPQPLTPGVEGVVESVDDIGTLHMRWSDGRSLGLIVGVDRFEVLPDTPGS